MSEEKKSRLSEAWNRLKADALLGNVSESSMECLQGMFYSGGLNMMSVVGGFIDQCVQQEILSYKQAILLLRFLAEEKGRMDAEMQLAEDG